MVFQFIVYSFISLVLVNLSGNPVPTPFSSGNSIHSPFNATIIPKDSYPADNMDFKSYLEMGERLGLKEEKLWEFALDREHKDTERQQQNQEREERRLKREHELKMKEIEDIQIQREHELAVREKERQHDIIEKDKQRHHEYEMARLQQQQPQDRANIGNVSVKPKGPKLPFFDESKDSIDAYIRRFERYATTNGWKEEHYAAYLSALLQGKALDVYAQMPACDVNDYMKLKQNLLKRFQMTEEGYRRKFHSSKMERGDTAYQFMAKLQDLFDNWIELAEVKKEYGDLRNFIIVEQFLHACPIEVSTHIREKEIKTMDEVIHAAEIFMDAHHIKPKQTRPTVQPSQPSQEHQTKQQATNQATRSYRSSITCFYCDKQGHKASECYAKKKAMSSTAAADIEPIQTEEDSCSCEHSASTCMYTSNTHQCKSYKKKPQDRIPHMQSENILTEDKPYLRRLPIVNGIVNGQQVKVLRDTGCTAAIIRKSIVKPHQFIDKKGRYVTVDQSSKIAQFAEVYIDSPFYTGILEFMCLDEPLCDVILGNLPSVISQPNDYLFVPPNSSADKSNNKRQQTTSNDANDNRDTNPKSTAPAKSDSATPSQSTKTNAAAVTTRSQAMQESKPMKSLKVPSLPELGDRAEFKEKQQKDPTLHQARKWAEIKKSKVSEKSKVATTFKIIQGLLYRITYSIESEEEVHDRQLVIPKKHRFIVMKLGHEAIMAGHMGINKTIDRIQSNFYWPNMYEDVTRFCKSCDICQRTVPRGRVPKAPLVNLPIVSTPFQRVSIDLIGPLHPPSARKHQYILTMVDMATRYPKAAPLVNIDTVTVAEALLKMFSDSGIPQEILSDRGTQFTSDVMKEVHRLLSIKSITTTPYHAQCNGLCEKYNGTLKQMLKRMIQDQPREWDRFIEPLLFAYREAPLDSLGGFSPFELLYGRIVRGPMSILREIWSTEEIEEEVKDTYEYVLDLRQRLQETCQLAGEELKKAQQNQKKYFDRHTTPRILKSGDEVLILLPTDSNKLLMKWKGPYEVKDKVGINNYAIQLPGKVKVFHINMLKKYFRQLNETTEQISVAAITFDDSEEEHPDILGISTTKKEETYKDININPELSSQRKKDITTLVKEFSEIFSSKPGVTTLMEHKITLTDREPVRSKPYPVPYALYPDMEKEIKAMLEMGIIEPSDSPYCSPIVIVKKSDGTSRYCQDMRQINKITRFDCESIPDIEAIYAKCAKDKYFSKLDFCKGYWQIPLEAKSKEVTAFSSPFGHYQYRMMSFGLVNSGATYSRMMRKLLRELENIDNFVDDVLSHTVSWMDQLISLRKLFERIRDAGLTVKPSKCFFGYTDIEFTGHRIAQGMLMTQKDKVQKIQNATAPQTKKQLKGLLGLTGYYRKFISHYATKVKPLTDLTRNSQPDRIKWSEEHEQVFKDLKKELSSEPVLKLPDVQKQFTLRTDASDTGLGAVLLQHHQDMLFPVAYISRKLLPREQNYSIMEKECLAVVWAVNKFIVYLYGVEFVLQTDHQSLAYLNKAKFNNQRVMRWALSLQPYRYRVEYIKGEDNLGADFLSRQ